MKAKLMDSVNDLANRELRLANESSPPFNSGYEGYAVLLEDVEEAEYEMDNVKSALECVWWSVKNDIQGITVENFRNSAVLLACKAIQVAAMLDRFADFMDSKETK